MCVLSGYLDDVQWKIRFFLLFEDRLEYYDPSREKDIRVAPLGCIYIRDITEIAVIPSTDPKHKYDDQQHDHS